MILFAKFLKLIFNFDYLNGPFKFNFSSLSLIHTLCSIRPLKKISYMKFCFSISAELGATKKMCTFFVAPIIFISVAGFDFSHAIFRKGQISKYFLHTIKIMFFLMFRFYFFRLVCYNK